jgi:uncharacterized RDD family membrane protein YckC
MNTTGLVMLKLFFLMNCVAGFLLMLVGLGMVEHPDLAVSLVGMMLSLMGILSFIWFGILFARREV